MFAQHSTALTCRYPRRQLPEPRTPLRPALADEGPHAQGGAPEQAVFLATGSRHHCWYLLLFTPLSVSSLTGESHLGICNRFVAKRLSRGPRCQCGIAVSVARMDGRMLDLPLA